MQQFELYIARCLQLARLGEYYVAPNPMVGAVLVADYGYSQEELATNSPQILGEGWHMRYGGPHAEPNCLRDAEYRHPECIYYKHCTL